MEESENFTHRLAAARSLGIPESVRDYIAAQTYPRAWRWRYTALQVANFVLMIAVPVATGVGLFRLIKAIEASRTELGYFSAENHGWGALVILFGLFFAWAGVPFASLLGERFAEYVAVRGITSRLVRTDAAAFDDNANLSIALAKWLCRRAAARTGTSDPSRFLREQPRMITRWFAWAGAVLLALGLVAWWIDLGAYAVGTDHGVERHSAFDDSVLPWSGLQRVKVGCAELSSGRPFTIYELVFADGQTVSAMLHPTARAVERLAPLDASLRARGIPVEWRLFPGGPNAGRPTWTPGCFGQVGSAIGVDGDALARILSPN
jgi:hypothetical protein